MPVMSYAFASLRPEPLLQVSWQQRVSWGTEGRASNLEPGDKYSSLWFPFLPLWSYQSGMCLAQGSNILLKLAKQIGDCFTQVKGSSEAGNFWLVQRLASVRAVEWHWRCPWSFPPGSKMAAATPNIKTAIRGGMPGCCREHIVFSCTSFSIRAWIFPRTSSLQRLLLIPHWPEVGKTKGWAHSPEINDLLPKT